MKLQGGGIMRKIQKKVNVSKRMYNQIVRFAEYTHTKKSSVMAFWLFSQTEFFYHNQNMFLKEWKKRRYMEEPILANGWEFQGKDKPEYRRVTFYISDDLDKKIQEIEAWLQMRSGANELEQNELIVNLLRMSEKDSVAIKRFLPALNKSISDEEVDTIVKFNSSKKFASDIKGLADKIGITRNDLISFIILDYFISYHIRND